MDEGKASVNSHEGATIQPKFYGLTRSLWRMALVVGIAQFAMSLWSWEFGIFLELDLATDYGIILQKWEIALVFSIGTAMTIIGYILSGTIADLIGRKNTMALALIPMAIGLFGLRIAPTWPLVLVEYGILQFGWAFIIIVSSAIAADEIATMGGIDSAKIFNVVLLPAFAVDGLSPIIASLLMERGFTASDLHMFAGVGSVVALIATLLFIRESLTDETIRKARSGPLVSISGFGRDFWKFTAVMTLFIIFFRSASPYQGNLVVGEWGGISTEMFGYAWSGFSLTSAILLSVAGKWADKNLRGAMAFVIVGNGALIFTLGVTTGLAALWAVNILWAFPIALWIGAEKTLVTKGAGEEMKGRALGTYNFILSIGGLIAFNLGAYLWELWGSLRAVFIFAGIVSMLIVIVVGLVLRSMKSIDKMNGGKAKPTLGLTE